MDIAYWRQQINGSLDDGAVLEVMNRFLESLDPEEHAALPAELRRRLHVSSAEEVSGAAYALANAWLKTGSSSGDASLRVGRISVVFAQASRRLAQIAMPKGYWRFQEWMARPWR